MKVVGPKFPRAIAHYATFSAAQRASGVRTANERSRFANWDRGKRRKRSH